MLDYYEDLIKETVNILKKLLVDTALSTSGISSADSMIIAPQRLASLSLSPK